MKINQKRIEYIAEALMTTKGITPEEVGPLGMFNIKSQIMQFEIWHARFNEEHGIMEVEMDPSLFGDGEAPQDG